MEFRFKVNTESQKPIYKQLIEQVEKSIADKHFTVGDYIPSMTEMAETLQISKETVKKAYNILRDRKVIDALPGKGFYVCEKQQTTRILVLFDELSTYKQVIYDSFLQNIGDDVEIEFHLFNLDISLFEYLVENNLDNFDYYVITPHLPLQPAIQKKAIQILKKIPTRKLILVDRYLKDLPGNFGSAYQDFDRDIYGALSQCLDILKKYRKLNVVFAKGSLYAHFIAPGVQKFCAENKIDFEIHYKFSPDIIKANEVYLVLSSRFEVELIELVRHAKARKLRIGKNIGVISYNESPVNEIILDGLSVFSTDFNQMGALAAKMINEKKNQKIRCDFRFIKRSSFR